MHEDFLKQIRLGLGCMPLTGCYGPINQNYAESLIKQAYEHGIRFFDTADNYGNSLNEQLLGAVFKYHAIKPFIATKVGVTKKEGSIVIDGSKEHIINACHASLNRLRVNHIDLLYLHHVDPHTPIEESIEALSKLIKEGKVNKIGLFEANLDMITRAQRIHPIYAYQAEYSFIARGVETSILPFCKSHNIHFIANAPFGRGLLSESSTKLHHLQNHDLRTLIPRFQSPYLEHNLNSISKLQTFANSHGFTLEQLSLIWLLRKSVIPIFGTTNLNHLLNNLESLNKTLQENDLCKLETLLKNVLIQGERIPPGAQDLYLSFS
jgi:aryl-alcohol dehydrogenase-like predicted oxidoreductase